MLNKARQIQDQIIAWRRDFHMHPETGFKEFRTSRVIGDILEGLGCRVRRGVARTGILAELGEGHPVIAIRADIDALPLEETNMVPYASCNRGVMHACGHDAHTAMLLGAAALLSREELPGTVRFLFQPSEEVNDEEGLSGAPRMIQDGVLKDVSMIIALHVDPATPVGTIRIDSGAVSGGVDSWFGRVVGIGGHGARPHEAIDPFYLTAHVILALNHIISRRLHPFDPAVVSIGSMNGGHTENVIPDSVSLTGTLRYTEPRVQEQIHAEIRKAFELTRSLGGDFELHFELGVPPMVNHEQAVALIRRAAADMLGDEHVLPTHKELGAEDFGRYLEVVPGAMLVLGTRIEGDERFGHNPRFDVNEGALPIGTALFAEVALRFLRTGVDSADKT